MGYKIHYPIKEKRKTTLKIFRGGADDTMCPICLEDFEQSEINTNETIRCESCFQHFHYDCIKHWCESSNEFLSIQNSVCPICRQSNICRNSNFVRRETEAARIRRGIRDNQMQSPSEISDIILSIGSEYRIRDNIGLTDLMYLDENWKFNRLNSENENERNENMTNWVADHLDKFINDMNNSAPNPESQWDIADNRAENARIFREEVQRATFNRDLPVWFIAPRPEDSLDIQHLRDLHQLKMFTYNEYNRLKRDYPVYSYLELLFSAEKRKINNERRVAKRKLIRISLRIFLYTMILIKKDTVSRGLTVDPVDMVEDSSESESETETETISTQTQTQTESETGSQTQEDTPVPEPDDGEVAEPQEDTPVPEPDNGEVAEPQEDTPVPEPDNGEVAEPQEGEENVVENDARFDWIPVEENPVEASAVEEAPMARNEAERPRARGWRLPRVQPPGLRVEREPDGTVLFRWRLPRVQPQEEETLGDGGDRILASRRATVAARARAAAANRRFEESQRQIADANRRFAESQRQIADLERRRMQIAENIPQEDTPAESTETHVDIVGGAGDLPDDRKELKEMCAKAGLPYNSKEPIERIKKRLTAPRGAAYGGFINSLHELLTNQKYSNIISWENDNDGNFLIVLKDNLLVAKELCPKANSEEGKKKTRYLSRSVQAMKDQFRSYDFNRISNRGENELVFSNPKVKSIDDILTLRGQQSRANQAARRRTRRKARLAVDEQGEPTNRPPRRAASTRLRYVESSSEEESADMAAMAVPRHVLLELDEQGDMHSVGEESADMAAMAVPRHVLLEHDEQGDLHSVGEESADMADMAAPRHVLLELDEQGDLHSVGEESADVDNNEAANILASITNINDENTEDLDRRTSYLQNLNTNNEHSLKIALLIESLKNHVIDENEKNQIKQKQNELWQGLKEIPMEDEQRRGVLYKYMFEYLKRTIPQAKLNEGAKIAQSNFESIKRAQIHNRPTKPLTESEQKQADEEMNAAISRGTQLAQDEDTNMSPEMMRALQPSLAEAFQDRDAAPPPPAPPPATAEPRDPAWYVQRDHIALRMKTVRTVARLLQSRKPDDAEWQRKVPQLAQRLEEELLLSARSFDEYGDERTLKPRLQALAVASASAKELKLREELESLKRENAKLKARIGHWVEVYWAENGEWFLARIVGQRRQSGRHELKVAYADGETTYEALRDVPFDGDGDPPAVADGEPRHWRRAEVPPVRKVVIDVDGLVERDVPIRRTGKPMRHHSRYASATTAREYVSLGGSNADLKYDLVNGFFVEDATPPPPRVIVTRTPLPVAKRPRTQAPPTAQPPPPGSRVAVRFKDGIEYAGTVEKVEDANHAFVRYDDGQSETVRFPDPDVRVTGFGPEPDDWRARTQAPRDARVGRWVEVYWAGDGEWFLGRVAGQHEGKLKIAYTDGEPLYQVLQDEPFSGDGDPPAPADGEPEHFRFAEAPQSGGVIYVDDENDKMRFECPLSLDIMEDPVIAEDGYSYEKEEIESWIKLSEDKGNPITSPITGDNMGKTLIPNTVLKDIIENSIFDRQRDVESLSQIEDENKNKGIVIQYKDTRFGFIHTFDGIDNLFFHSSQLDNQIIVGDIVSFVIKEYKGKPTATNIKLIESAWNRKTGVIVKYNNDKQYGFIEADINGMPHIFVHISEINQLVSVGDKVSFIIGKNMAGKAVAKKVKIINDEIGVEEEKKEDSEIPQLEQRLLMELIFERDRIMREREKVNSMIKSRK